MRLQRQSLLRRVVVEYGMVAMSGVPLARAGFSDFADTDERWLADLIGMIAALVRFMKRAGDARLVKGDYPREAGLRADLARWRGHPSAIATLENALLAAALDDAFERCVIHFGEPTRAAVGTGGGHPLLWTWVIGEGLDRDELLGSVAGALPLVNTTLDWNVLTGRDPEI
jgi:hypothetical protein